MREQDVAGSGRRDFGPLALSVSGWRQILKRSWRESGKDNLSLVASGVAFNAFLAFVPLLTAVIMSYGIIAAPEQIARHMAALAEVIPGEAARLVDGQLKEMAATDGSAVGFGLLFTLALALYGAMRGARGIIIGLNIVFDVAESRSFAGQTAMALAITFALIIVFILASIGVSVFGFLEKLLPALDGPFHFALKAVFWLLAAFAVGFVIAAIYCYAPNREIPEWRWLTPGSALATVVWIAATIAFSFYVRNFGSFNATYGALGTVIILLTWLYLSSYILLFGAELNRALERNARRDSGPDELVRE